MTWLAKARQKNFVPLTTEVPKVPKGGSCSSVTSVTTAIVDEVAACDASNGLPVNPANHVTDVTGKKHKVEVQALDATILRGCLLALAATEYRYSALVRSLSELDLAAYAEHFAGFEDPVPPMRALLSMLAEGVDRLAGRVPQDGTAAVLCAHYGPVFLDPRLASVLPLVASWLRAPACPWCLVRPPAGHRMPRPRVTCGACVHYRPDATNPDGGMGRCGVNATTGTTWPDEPRICRSFEPKP